ncbi:MAG: RNA 2',3'-cyclic phosphodiesterase [Phycisphaerales bacterium]
MAALRLFLAAYPSPAVADWLLARARALPLPEHKLVPADHVHITLLFLGDRQPGAMGKVEASVEAACKGIRPCIVRPLRLITLPDRGPARLVAAETDSPPSLMELQKRLSNRLAGRERRSGPFLPHMTLVRFPGSGADYTATSDLSADGRDASPLQFEVRTIHLIKSTLHPKGPVHESLREFALG